MVLLFKTIGMWRSDGKEFQFHWCAVPIGCGCHGSILVMWLSLSKSTLPTYPGVNTYPPEQHWCGLIVIQLNGKVLVHWTFWTFSSLQKFLSPEGSHPRGKGEGREEDREGRLRGGVTGRCTILREGQAPKLCVSGFHLGGDCQRLPLCGRYSLVNMVVIIIGSTLYNVRNGQAIPLT
jgi:hypothetical protein